MRLRWEEFKLKILLQRTHDKSVNLKLGRLIGGNRDLTIKFVMRRVCGFSIQWSVTDRVKFVRIMRHDRNILNVY